MWRVVSGIARQIFVNLTSRRSSFPACLFIILLRYCDISEHDHVHPSASGRVAPGGRSVNWTGLGLPDQLQLHVFPAAFADAERFTAVLDRPQELGIHVGAP